MAQLEEERRQPREVEEQRRCAGDGGLAPVLAREEEGRDGEPGTEEERPVVRVQQEVERQHEQRQVAPATEHDTVRIRRGRDDREARRQRVHPRLLAVVGEEGVDRRQRCGDPAGGAPEERLRRPVGERGAGDRRDERQRVRRALAVAEPADPHVEEQVVERRRTVLPEQVRNRREVMVRDPDGDALVDPEARAQHARAQPERRKTEETEDTGRRPARQRSRVETEPRALDRLRRRHTESSRDSRFATIRRPSWL